MTFLEKVKLFAHNAHDSIGQTRKYGNKDPYWVHTDEVARIVSLFTKDEDVIAAAHLHDVLEDVPNVSIIDMMLMVGAKHARVGPLVRELTDIYTSENFPKLNRKERKTLEAERLGLISNDGKLIKLADLFSNTRSIVRHDPGFAKIYLQEKEKVLYYIRDGLPFKTRILYGLVKLQLWLAKGYLRLFWKNNP